MLLIASSMDLHQALFARLETLVGVTAFDGEVDSPPKDGSGRVLPYVVLYGGTDSVGRRARLADSTRDLTWSPQVTCVAGYQVDCMYLSHQVRTLLVGWEITTVAGADAHELVELPSPGVTLDKVPTPPRWLRPLTFRTLVSHSAPTQ